MTCRRSIAPASWATDLVTSKVGEPRYEVKLVANGPDLTRVITWLRVHSAGFAPSYPQRRVNNIYFDTPDLANVAANLAGISKRSKIRLRWYGQTNEIVQGRWEIKRKQAGLGWKVTQPMPHAIRLDRASTWAEVVARLRSTASDTIANHLAGMFVPTLINHYERRYYESWDRTIRATVDHSQKFYDQRLGPRPNLTRRTPLQDDVILELKAAPERYERLVDIVQQFPMRVARNSKYVNGMLGSVAS